MQVGMIGLGRMGANMVRRLMRGGHESVVYDASTDAVRGLHDVDCGTSGGPWGLERGYCLMIGGEAEVMGRRDPLFATLAPGVGSLAATPGREQRGSTAERGYLHCGCGPSGAGRFVKMVHNGIEYGLMAAYAEGFNILRHANVEKHAQAADAETRPRATRSTTSTTWIWRTSPTSGGVAA
jgi:6-phosphogluconate dehydrogenase